MKYPLPETPLKFILFFLAPYGWYFFGLLLIALLWSIDASLEPYIVKLMIDVLEYTPKEENYNLISQLKLPILLFIFLRIFINFINRLFDYFSLKIMPNFNKDIVIRLAKYIQKHSHSYFQNHFGGSIVSNIQIVADTSESILDTVIHKFIYPFFSLLLFKVTMSSVNPILGLIFLCWSLIFISVSYFLSFRVYTLSKEFSEKYTTLVGKLIDSITNILAVQLFARRKYEINLLKSISQSKVDKFQELRWAELKRNAAMEMMASALIGILMYYLILQRQERKISIGDFALICTLSLSIIDIIWDISRNYIHFIGNIGKCTQALKIIRMPYEVKDAPDALPLNVTQGIIEFKKVFFRYEKHRYFFKNISIKINKNERVGIVGHSGSGKTTFVNLILRLFDLESGSILIDGQDIKNVTQDSLHQNISFIPQDPLFFHRTILENIKYGNLDAEETEVIAAAQKAHADQFIKTLPQGYHTLVGERGSKLSGGQKQRIAIARVILKNSKILILDEATSALDSETEHYIQESFDKLMKNKTVLVVAHRLSTLIKMDRIIVFKEGKIVEEGNHKDLLQKKGIYENFWNMQVNNSISE